jgi:leucyl aminopeptidase
MRSELLQKFDATAAAKPVYRVIEKSEDLKNVPASLKSLAAANNFAGEFGIVLANDDGVLLGAGDGADPFVTGACCERLPEGDYSFKTAFDPRSAELAALGWLFGAYRFDRYKKQKKPVARLVAPEGVDVAKLGRIAEAVWRVRDLVNIPAGDMLPEDLEKEARRIGEPFGADVTSIVGDDLLAKNFPMVHAVGRAATAAPRLIDLKWGRSDAPKVMIVGKGVCFDSGGLDIKPSAGMLIMKKDMGGAANALGLAQLVMGAGLDLRLRVIIPAVENAISGSAYRPGDILKSRKGLTVEIGNTDAEGRLVLADAMTYALEDSPQHLFTLATLTGAARVALGPDLPPFYTDDDALAAAIIEASVKTADWVWRMPLWGGYDSMLPSTVADVNNSANGAFAGSVTAALFLKRFVPAGTSWAHFDIFAWRPKALPGRPLGGEAQSMRALFELLAEKYGK